MKKYVPYIVGGLALVLCFGFLAKSCRLVDEYSKLKGAYEEARRIAEADHEIMLKKVEAAQAVIEDRDKAIAESTKKIGDLTKSIGEKTAQLGKLDTDLAAAKTDAERVPILTSMVETWKVKYADLEGVVAEKDKQIDSYRVKETKYVEILSTYKAQYEAEHRLRLAGETLNKTLESKFKGLQFSSKVKTVALVAVAGLAGYSLLKGK